jgi:Protein of unknown function (DUF3592)
MPSLGSRIVAYLFLAVVCSAGPIVLLIAAGTGIERALFIHASRPADGVIVGLAWVPTRKFTRARFPVFRFTTSDGQSYSVTSTNAQSPPPWRLGDRVAVLYDPRHPQNAHIDSIVQLWEAQMILGVVGAGFSTVPLLFFLVRRR